MVNLVRIMTDLRIRDMSIVPIGTIIFTTINDIIVKVNTVKIKRMMKMTYFMMMKMEILKLLMMMILMKKKVT
jgi:hypothetical protein